jgi:hypothetical protein
MTAHLYVLSGPDVGRSFEVRPGDTIGRSPDCIITVRDPSVSRKHAHLEQEGGTWYVVDDGSRNGVKVGDVRQRRAPIGDMDEFSLGELLLRFRDEAQAAAPAAAPSPAPPPAAAPPPPPPPPPPPQRADEEGGLELEDPDEIELEAAAPDPRASLARTTVAPGPAARTSASSGGTGGAGERILQYSKVEGGGGFSASDLGQYPLWVRLTVLLLGAALMVAIAFLAFRGTSFIKGKTGGGATVDGSE